MILIQKLWACKQKKIIENDDSSTCTFDTNVTPFQSKVMSQSSYVK